MLDSRLYTVLWWVPMLFFHLHFHGISIRRDPVVEPRQATVNGADSAQLYDTTVRYKKEELYLRYEGRITMIGNFAEAIAGIFGGLLAAYSLRLPFYAQAFVAFIGIPAAFALQEFNTKSKVQNPVSEILRI